MHFGGILSWQKWKQQIKPKLNISKKTKHFIWISTAMLECANFTSNFEQECDGFVSVSNLSEKIIWSDKLQKSAKKSSDIIKANGHRLSIFSSKWARLRVLFEPPIHTNWRNYFCGFAKEWIRSNAIVESVRIRHGREKKHNYVERHLKSTRKKKDRIDWQQGNFGWFSSVSLH